MIRREDNTDNNDRKANGEAQDQSYEDLQQREFSSIFVFKIRMKGANNNPVPPLKPQNDIYKIIDLIASKTFKFESEAYKLGFGKPLKFGKEILVVPYYDNSYRGSKRRCHQ